MVNFGTLVAKGREKLDDTYWLIPGASIGAAIGLAATTLYLDSAVHQHEIKRLAFVYAGGSDGARSLLSSIATCMMSVTGTVFSITVAVLTLASQQFGPRLLTNFMRDKGNQLTMGIFLGTFIYSLLVLRTVTGGDAGLVPHISVTVAVALAVLSCCVLVYFIHHLAVSLRASYVIATVATDLTETAFRLFPEGTGHGGPKEPARLAEGFESSSYVVAAKEDGYLRFVDSEMILSLSVKDDLQVRIDVHPGEYIIEGQILALAGPREKVSERTRDRMLGAFHIGKERSRVQDIGASLNQLAEVAVRALSSNQVPHTAEQCLDRLGSLLVCLAGRSFPTPARYDDEGRFRLLAPPYTYRAILDACFDPIRESARSNILVLIHLLEVIRRVIPSTHEPAMLDELRRHADMTTDVALARCSSDEQRSSIELKHRELIYAIEGQRLTGNLERAEEIAG